MSWILRTLVSSAVSVPLLAAEPALPANPATPPAAPCDRPECRQFDFWVGDWEVRTADGKLAGTNRVDKILAGCVVFENWSGARGMHGKSFNMYDAGRQLWHQTWVDDHGTLLTLEGTFHDGEMVLDGQAPASGGGTLRHRITWEPLADGQVKQHWTTSADDGQTWQDAFVGFYRRKK